MKSVQLVLISFILSVPLVSTAQSGKATGITELVITPMVGNKPLYIDSTYSTPDPAGIKYTLKKLKFFISDIAFAPATGKEVSITSEKFKNGVYLIDFQESNFDAGHGKQSYKIEFKLPQGQYSDIRFNIGVPRSLNHQDPTVAPPPLDVAKADMYWAWNSGYIFLLAEGKLTGHDFFHFAVGGDARIMPMYFGNLFNVKPLIQITDKNITRINFILDFSEIFKSSSGSYYSIQGEENAIVHGGHQADALRNNFLKALKYSSVTIADPKK